MPTAAFTTLGCKVNQYETQKILESFEEAGFEIVPFDGPADVYVVNTCSVTGQAESKSRYTVRKARRSNPRAKVVVTGCAAQMELNTGVAQTDHESLLSASDVLVPNPEKLKTLQYVLSHYPEFTGVRAGPTGPRPAGRTRATLKVQDGCNVFCSYCSIPFTRPGLVSRPWKDVLSEAQRMAESGYHEAVLTGVLIGAYGPDTGSGGPNFDELVGLLARDSGLERIRISSIEVHQVSPAIVRLASEGHIVPHFHIPLQSGDDNVLADMNRRYRQRDYLDLCARLYREVPGLSLTTDVMVGFPTESSEGFESSVHVLEQVGFLKAHVFRFSPRPGTPADQWGDPVPPQEKQQRAQRLSAISDATGCNHVRRFLGQTLRVLVEGKIGKDGLLEGLTDNWITVKFAGSPQLARTVQWIRLDECEGTVAHGELVNSPVCDQLVLTSRTVG